MGFRCAYARTGGAKKLCFPEYLVLLETEIGQLEFAVHFANLLQTLFTKQGMMVGSQFGKCIFSGTPRTWVDFHYTMHASTSINFAVWCKRTEYVKCAASIM